MTKRGSGGWRPFTPSVDQITSRKGYGMSDVRLIVPIANVAMNG